ncbi:hypothetical protein [Sorangium sp. So ce341]|uniref:hypothetical protein n=1 Tax=Sorangium sp. So ce341 TaxID=3133302 RepID=UPI003F63E8CB
MLTITSQTVSTARTNRARTRVGVGERVRLTATPASVGTVSWSVSGGGTVSPATGATTTFTSGDRTSTSVVTARGGGCTQTITFHVVEPTDAYQVQSGATIHNAGSCNAGFHGVTYLLPKDVSFENVEINEGVVYSTATGSFDTAGWNNLRHPEWPSWASVGGGTDATGSLVQGPNFVGGVYFDYIYSGSLPSACPPGDFVWRIPWRFRVNGGAEKVFTHLTHHAVADGARKMTMSKSLVSVFATEP